MSNEYIKVNKNLFKKALNCIIINSINYSSIGETLKVTLYKKEKTILEVENSGVHINENEFDNIFKPFYRIEKSRNKKTGGSGLGLYIVKNILDMNKFQFKLFNTETGVCFRIIF